MPRSDTVDAALPPWRPDPDRIGSLRTKVFLNGVAVVLVTAIPLFASSAYLVVETFEGLRDLRANLAPGEATDSVEFLKSRPDLVYAAVGVALLGVAAGAIGVWALQKTVGPQRRPPQKLLLALTCFPLGCGAVAALSAPLTTPLAGVIVVCLGIGWCFWLIPLQLFMLAVGMLTIARNSSLERQTFVQADQLPGKAIDYFDDVEPALIELGVERIGDLAYPPTKGKCRRLWANPSRTVFVSATHFPTSNGPICTVSAYSITESGKWFETASLKTPFQAPEGYQEQFNTIPDASPETVLRLQFEALQTNLRENGDRPMQVSRDEQEQMTIYGSAYLMQAKREKTGADVLWLADQYLGLPMPPAPGRPWDPEQEPTDAVEAFA